MRHGLQGRADADVLPVGKGRAVVHHIAGLACVFLRQRGLGIGERSTPGQNIVHRVPGSLRPIPLVHWVRPYHVEKFSPETMVLQDLLPRQRPVGRGGKGH